MSNFKDVSRWLAAAGKEPGNTDHISLQIGVHLEEFVEFLNTISVDAADGYDVTLSEAIVELDDLANALKYGTSKAKVINPMKCLDALCDCEVTGNGIAYLCGFDKDGADDEVSRSNWSKFVDGKPVLAPGGKITKGPDYSPPDLMPYVKPRQAAA